MFQDLIAQMKENNIQTKRIADFLEEQSREAIALGLVPGVPAPPKSGG